MDAVSRVAGALAIGALSAAASAVEPPPYRAIPFDEVIGDGGINAGSVLTLSRWPTIRAGGEGLRFRFASETLVVGTVDESGADPTGLRAGSWRVGVPGSFEYLPGLNGAGSLVADANRNGSVVGAVVVPAPELGLSSVHAAAWRLPMGDLGGSPTLQLVFPQGEPDCFGTTPHTMLTAVGPAAITEGSAMVAGIGALVGHGTMPDGFIGELVVDGGFDQVKRLPGFTTADWCGDWYPPEETRISISQCVAWGGGVAPDDWSSFWAIGSHRMMTGDLQAMCIDTDKWDLTHWTWTEQLLLIPACRGCDTLDDPAEYAPVIPECVLVSPEDNSVSFFTDLRMSSFAPEDVSGARPLALGGIIDVRAGPDMQFACGSLVCPVAHAAVVLSHTGLSSDEEPLFDLHTVLPTGLADEHTASGIARIYPWGPSGIDEAALGWVAVGAVGKDFQGGDELNKRHGCIWLGQVTGPGTTEWCAFDINPLTIMPQGMNIEAIHDINCHGVAVGVATEVVGAAISTRLVYLTEAADLSGDLVTDGADLTLFLPFMKSGCPGNALYDLDGDGCVGGGDLGMLLAAWDGNGPGGAASVALTCHDSPWGSPLRRYPYIGMAANFLGFESLDALGDALLLLEPDSALGLCEVVDAVATAMEGEE